MKHFHIELLTRNFPLARIGRLTTRSHREVDFIGYTVELPYKSNKNDISCISKGGYDIIDHVSGSKNKWADGRVLAIINPQLGVGLLKGEAVRHHCYFHSANHPWELKGCVAPGLTLHPTRIGVAKSRQACKLMFKYFDNGWTKLVIE